MFVSDRSVQMTCKWCIVILIAMAVSVPLIIYMIDTFGIVNLYSITPTP